MRLIQEERGPTVATHVYEPGSYVPLARIDLSPTWVAPSMARREVYPCVIF